MEHKNEIAKNDAQDTWNKLREFINYAPRLIIFLCFSVLLFSIGTCYTACVKNISFGEQFSETSESFQMFILFTEYDYPFFDEEDGRFYYGNEAYMRWLSQERKNY